MDANGDGRKDPYNPVDAICAAASYLKAAGGHQDLYKAIFAYNHADWYVQEVLLYARAYGKLPTDLVGSLTGLTEGAHFPVAADARYADDISARAALSRSTSRTRDEYGNAADVISSSPTRRGINIFAAEDAPVVAVNDGVIVKMGNSPKLGRYVVLRDAYGNRFTYAKLGRIVRKQRTVVMPTGKEKRIPVDSQNIRPRLYALPGRDGSGRAGQTAREGVDYAAAAGADGSLKVGSKVIAGTVLARIGAGEDGIDPHINFSIRPAGRGAPRIDPKPILDGWKLLEATAIYRAKGKNPFNTELSGAGVLLLSKEALVRRVLADEHLSIYDCGRTDIASGQIDRRVLAMLEYLVSKGYELTITSLKCGHGIMTASGYVSEHSTGDAVDIAGDQRRAGDRPPGAGDPDRRADQDRPAAAGDDAPTPGDLARGPARPDQLRRSPTTTTTSMSATSPKPAPSASRSTPSCGRSSGCASPTGWGRSTTPKCGPRPPSTRVPDKAAKAGERRQGRAATAAPAAATEALAQLFGFAQFEFAGTIGVPDGRYLARESGEQERQRVLVVETLAAPPPPSRRRRQPRTGRGAGGARVGAAHPCHDGARLHAIRFRRGGACLARPGRRG